MPEECVDILYSFYFIHTFYLKKMFRKSSFVVVIALNAHAYLKYVWDGTQLRDWGKI